MLGVFKPGALNLIYLPLSRYLDSLLYDPMAPTPDLVFFSTDVTDVSGGVIIFVKQNLSFSELSTSSLSSLDPCSDFVEVNISLNNFSSLSFLNVYAPPIRSSTKGSRTNFFSPSILPSYVEAEAVDFCASASTEKGPLPLPASASASTSLPRALTKQTFNNNLYVYLMEGI